MRTIYDEFSQNQHAKSIFDLLMIDTHTDLDLRKNIHSLADLRSLYQRRYNANLFKSLLLYHETLQLEHALFCNQIDIKIRTKTMRNQMYTTQWIIDIAAGLIVTDILETFYTKYLCIPREAHKMIIQRQQLERLFNAHTRFFEYEQHTIANIQQDNIQIVRKYHSFTNYVRLIIVRINRLLNSIQRLIASYSPSALYVRYIGNLNYFTAPIFSYFAWIAFFPRLICNMSLLIKHAVSRPNLDSKISLFWYDRLRISWKRRWFQICNDLVWAISGVLNCFVLTGSAAPIGMYITLALYAYDVVLAAIKGMIELTDLIRLRKNHLHFSSPNAPTPHLKITSIEERIAFEKRNILINVTTAAILFIGFLLSMPLIISSPICAIIGSIILLATTIISNYALKQHDAKKPIESIADDTITQHIGFFKINSQESLLSGGVSTESSPQF